MPYPEVMDEFDTVRAALAGRSIARFGDGELKICTGRSAKSQPGFPGLRKSLLRILKAKGHPCLACIPRITAASPKAAFWEDYAGHRYSSLYRVDQAYGSAFISRPDSAPWCAVPEYWGLVRQLWAGQHIVLVRGEGVKGLRPSDMPEAAKVDVITGPVQNAWLDYAGLMSAVIGKAEKKSRVVLCLGATATALAHGLGGIGIHALDLGHLALFMRKLDTGADPTVRTEEDRHLV